MTSRYRNREIYENRENVYEELREKRGVKKVSHYGSPEFKTPTLEERMELTTLAHSWTHGDRFYKLSHKHYGTTKYWWLIAKFNGIPTEAHLKIGDKIDIPLPLNKALAILEED
tara:strand:- start:351 stop:692 length:342 start_codon:yes stop_codon:yes gene_type:complete